MGEQSYNLKYTGKEIDDLLDKANDMDSSAQVPNGGGSGQVLIKKSDTDFDTEWETLGTTLPSGGTADQILTKNSSTDGDASWKDAPVALPTGGSAGQALVKNSSTDYDVKWTTIKGGGTSDSPLIIETNAVESFENNTVTSTVLTAEEIKTLLADNENTIFLAVPLSDGSKSYYFTMHVTYETNFTNISGFFQPGYDKTAQRQPVWLAKLDLTKDVDNVTLYYQQNLLACKVFPMISTGTTNYYKADGWTFDDLRTAVYYLSNHAVIRISNLGYPLFLNSFSNLDSDTDASITFNSQLSYYANTIDKRRYPRYYSVTITPSNYTNVLRNLYHFGCGYIPDGGTTGQILAKYSDSSYATQWIDPPSNSHFNTVLLWTNTNTTFDAQTVTISNLSNYEWFIIVYTVSGLSPRQTMMVKYNSGDTLYLNTQTDTTHFRKFTINGNNLIFENNYYYIAYNSESKNTANTHTIPIAVYGVT